jgi:signal transduction histidine kinase/ActR/RegA family two-component response regulator
MAPASRGSGHPKGTEALLMIAEHRPDSNLPAPDFKHLFESLPGLYLVLDLDLLIVAVSDDYLEATMTRREEILGRSLFDVFPDNPDDPGATGERNLKASLDRVVATGVCDRMDVQKYDIRRPACEGGSFEERYWSPLNSPLLGDDGSVTFIIHRVEDVTELIRLQQQGVEKDRLTDELRLQAAKLEHDVRGHEQARSEREQLLASERQARNDAECASRMKDEFLATLSHELRTPLNAILGWATLLRMAPPGAAEIEDGIATIERNARAQARLIEDLLDMNSIISGKLRLDLSEVDLIHVIDAALQTVRPGADAKGVVLGLSLDASAAFVRGDANRLLQVVWNFLSNAIKFTPRGGKVQLSLTRVSSQVEIRVCDTGEGIEPEFLPYVFDRFRQADGSTTRRHGGLGIGLAIAKQLVELHGGTVRAESAGLNQGALFVASLPIATVLENERPADLNRPHPDQSSRNGDHEAEPLDNVAILVVDDEPDACNVVKRVLERCNARVQTAHSATEALTMLDSYSPDVLISDLGMPGMDGYDFIRQVRSRGAEDGGDVAAVALTALARPDDHRRAIIAGYQMHLSKPVEARQLLAVVASLAGRTASAE